MIDDVPYQAFGRMVVWSPSLTLTCKLLGLVSSLMPFDDSRWGHAQDLDERFGEFPTSSPLLLALCNRLRGQKTGGVILALQAFSGIHVGIDDLDVLGSVARLLQQNNQGKPLSLIPDATIRSMLSNREYATVQGSCWSGYGCYGVSSARRHHS